MGEQPPHYPGYPPYPPPEDEIDLADLIRVLLAHKVLILAVTFLAVMAGGTYGYLQPRMYEAETLLAPAQEEGGGPSIPGGLGGLASMAGVDLGGGGGKLEEALATLKSRRFLTAFIEDRELLPALFPEKWDADKGEWDVPDPDRQPSLANGYGKFKNEVLTVSRDKERGLVTLKITWRDREQAAAWANALVERLNREIREEEIDRLSRRVEYLRSQARETNIAGVREALFSIMESQLKSQTVAKTQRQYVFRVIDPAVAPEKGQTTGTSLRLILALSTVLGLFLGVFGAFLWQFIQQNFRQGGQEESGGTASEHQDA